MKSILLALSYFILIVSIEAQDSTLGMNKALTTKIKKHRNCLQRFEQKDTTDAATGRKFSISQFYYFNKDTRQLQLVHIVENPKNQGDEIYYTYYNNQLIKAELIPSSDKCTKCTKEYFYWNNQQVCKQGPCEKDLQATVFLQHAAMLKSKVPDNFPVEYLNKN